MPRRSDKRSEGNSSHSATSSSRTALLSLAFLRVFVGGKFLQAGFSHWAWMGHAGLRDQILRWEYGATPTPWRPYAPILLHTVLPHFPLFTLLLVGGELVIGTLLLLGLMTRMASFFALFLSVNYLLTLWNAGPATQGYQEMLIALTLVFIVTGAGRTFGLDASLARKHPRLPLW